MYDHAVFALYSISFMSLLFILGSGALTLDITSGCFWTPLLVAPFTHMFAQLKGTYSLSRIRRDLADRGAGVSAVDAASASMPR